MKTYEKKRELTGSKVVVVGGAGFLGSHLVEHLIQDRGCKVMALDNLVAGRREYVHKAAEFIHCDITLSEWRMFNLFKGWDFVFNYAAEPYVPMSFIRPIHVFMVNAVGAMHVINAAHEAGCKGILQISSAEIYGAGWDGRQNEGTSKGRPDDLSINENGTVKPHSSYGASKAAIDAWIQSRWMEAETPVISLRQFNCVGERETHPYVIPEIISQLSRQRGPALIRLGNNSFRDFLYAGDQAVMATELLEYGEVGGIYNLGSEKGVRVYDLVPMIAKAFGTFNGFPAKHASPVLKDEARVRPWEIWHLLSDNSKIHATIPSRPKVSLQDAINRTVKDYIGNKERWPWE